MGGEIKRRPEACQTAAIRPKLFVDEARRRSGAPQAADVSPLLP